MLNMILKNKRISTWVIVVVFAVLAIVPLFVTRNYTISILIYCLAFAAFGSAWNLIGGYGGQISWCHSAFAAIGAYTGYICLKFFGLSPWLTMPLGMLIAFVFATMIGYGTFKLTGAYFSLSTMAFAEILRIIILYMKPQTGGAAGIYVSYTGATLKNLAFDNDRPFYYLMLIVLAVVVVIVSIFEKTKTGNYLRVIKEDETAALSLGIATFKVKLTAFQLSAVITSVVGVFYGFFLAFIDPISLCGNDLAVKIGLVPIIGGLGNIMGPILGAFIIIPLTEAAALLFGPRGGSQLLYGLGIILIVLFMPDGLIQIFKNLWAKAQKKAAGTEAAAEKKEG